MRRAETRHRLRRAVACLPSGRVPIVLEGKRSGCRPQGVPGRFAFQRLAVMTPD